MECLNGYGFVIKLNEFELIFYSKASEVMWMLMSWKKKRIFWITKWLLNSCNKLVVEVEHIDWSLYKYISYIRGL